MRVIQGHRDRRAAEILAVVNGWRAEVAELERLERERRKAVAARHTVYKGVSGGMDDGEFRRQLRMRG